MDKRTSESAAWGPPELAVETSSGARALPLQLSVPRQENSDFYPYVVHMEETQVDSGAGTCAMKVETSFPLAVSLPVLELSIFISLACFFLSSLRA